MNGFETKFFCLFKPFLELSNRFYNPCKRYFSEKKCMIERFSLVRREQSCHDRQVDGRFANREPV
jgi:hypothetical protein